MKIHIAIFSIVLALLTSCNNKTEPKKVIHDDWKTHYDSLGVRGCFVLLDASKNEYTYCNEAMANEGFIPASTFKIFNTLISLQSGVVQDENTVIKWDSTNYGRSEWNADHDLKTAYKHSCVWYYQELAKRLGPARMKMWLDTLNYGNRDTAGGPIHFWLNGKMRITPNQQIDFLKKLQENKLPLSARAMNLTKQIMLQDSTATYKMRAKTGWGEQDDSSTCWYVGWVETKGNVYYFANLFRTKEDFSPELASKRKEMVYSIFRKLKLI